MVFPLPRLKIQGNGKLFSFEGVKRIMFYSSLGARLSLQAIPSSGYTSVNLTYFKGSQLCLFSSHLTLSLLVPYLRKYRQRKWVCKARFNLANMGKQLKSSEFGTVHVPCYAVI